MKPREYQAYFKGFDGRYGKNLVSFNKQQYAKNPPQVGDTFTFEPPHGPMQKGVLIEEFKETNYAFRFTYDLV